MIHWFFTADSMVFDRRIETCNLNFEWSTKINTKFELIEANNLWCLLRNSFSYVFFSDFDLNLYSLYIYVGVARSRSLRSSCIFAISRIFCNYFCSSIQLWFQAFDFAWFLIWPQKKLSTRISIKERWAQIMINQWMKSAFYGKYTQLKK